MLRRTLLHFMVAGSLASATWALPAAAVPSVARVGIAELKAGGGLGAFGPLVDIPATEAPYTLARTFTAGSQDYLLLVSGISGHARVVRLTATGSYGGIAWDGDLPVRDWRGMDVLTMGNSALLSLFSGKHNEVMSFWISSTGVINPAQSYLSQRAGPADATHFDAYLRDDGHAQVHAYDTFLGSSLVSFVPFSEAAAGYFSEPGWSEIDHVTWLGNVYRLQFKGVGDDPFSPSMANGASAGRRQIHRLDASGSPQVLLLDDDLIDDPTDERWTSMRFYPRGATPGILAYNRHTGRLRTSALTTGFTETSVNQPTMNGVFDDVFSYRRNDKAFLVGVEYVELSSLNKVVNLEGDPAARLAQCVHRNLDGRSMGYQLSLLQNGSHLIHRAHGMRQVASQALPMERDTRVELASISKLITTLTVMKLAELGIVELDDPLWFQIDSDQYPPAELDLWLTQRTPRDLLTMTSGFSRAFAPKCTPNGNTLQLDCSTFFGTTPDLTCGTWTPDENRSLCPRSYVNSNFGTLRKVIEAQTDIATTPELDALTRSLWLDETAAGPSCQVQSDSMYFNRCTVDETCFSHEGHPWRESAARNIVDGWNTYCANGGWHASARDVTQILERLAGEQILSAAGTAEVLRTDLVDWDDASTAVGFDPAYEPRDNASMPVLGKVGDATGYGHTYSTNLEGNGQVALLANSSVGLPDLTLVSRRAYKVALAEPNVPCDVLSTITHGSAGGSRASEVATVDLGSYFVTAFRTSAGRLGLTSWRRDGQLGFSRKTTIENTDAAERITAIPAGSDRLVVGYRTKLGTMKLALYRLEAGVPTLLDHEAIGGGTDIELVRTHPLLGRFVTVLRTASNKLQVIAFELTASNAIVQKGSYTSAGEVGEVAAARGMQFDTLLTSIQTSTGNIKPIAFSVSASGQVTRHGSAPGSAQTPASDIRMGTRQVDGVWYFVSSMKNEDGELALGVWTLSPDLNTVTKLSSRTLDEIQANGNIVSGPSNLVFINVIDTNGNAVIKPFQLSADGTVFTSEQALDDGAATAISSITSWTGADLLTTTSISEGSLKVVNRELLLP